MAKFKAGDVATVLVRLDYKYIDCAQYSEITIISKENAGYVLGLPVGETDRSFWIKFHERELIPSTIWNSAVMKAIRGEK